MANNEIIEQARNIILSAQPDDQEARKTVWTLLNENNLLVGRARLKPQIEEFYKRTIRRTIAGENVDSNTQSKFTFLAHLIFEDETLLPERLGIKLEQLPRARAFFSAMDKDIRPE
jgi:hypothetical protein